MRWSVTAGSQPSRCGREGDAAQAQLQEAVESNSKGGRPPKAETAAHRAAVKDPTLSEANRHPTDRKSRLIRQRPTS